MKSDGIEDEGLPFNVSTLAVEWIEILQYMGKYRLIKVSTLAVEWIEIIRITP